ncbi:MAG: dimethyl sulfoxide reductase anchor subunit [Hyphomicrobiales bacterium]|nr:dimethyl sulfoxide reductase anchor subunit [Hyphomicrobiales bacterium]
MKSERPILDRVPPRQQGDWDIRGALNFMLGGAGAGLLAAVACATPLGLDLPIMELLGLALVGAGLFCVWLKIGRPWRALHVFRRPSTSWMSREAWLAPVVFACGAAAILTQAALFFYVAGLLGLVYAYAQGRILKANIGIPAWRRWSCVVLIVATALAEGFGLLSIGAVLWPALTPFGYALAVAIALRYAAWRAYRADLRETGAPSGTLQVFDAFAFNFGLIGHGAALVLAVAGAYASQPLVAAAGGFLASLAGALFKYTLVCRAAFTQGFSLPRTPARGKGKSGVGAQPGWQAGRGS